MADALSTPGPIVVIPAYNEEGTIAAIVSAARGQGYAVLVVNDRSQDGTRAAALLAGAEVLDLPVRIGAWGATQAGMRFALRLGRRVVVTLDGDGQHPPEDIATLAGPVAAGRADLVIGSCTERGSAARQLAWRMFRSITGLRVQDLTSGFRAYGPKAARVMIGAEAVLADYQDLGVLLLARRRGLRVEETPVRMCPRASGKSHIFSSWLKVGRYMVYSVALAFMRR